MWTPAWAGVTACGPGCRSNPPNPRPTTDSAPFTQGVAPMQPPDVFRPLALDDFSFHGFDQRIDHIKRKINGVGIWGGEPGISVVDGGVFVPAAKSHQNGVRFSGGILDGSGREIEAAHLRRQGREVVGRLGESDSVHLVRELDEEVLYLGWFFAHFGHFLLESLARSWCLDRFDRSLRVVFHHPAGLRLEGAAGRILEHLGIPRERIIVLGAPTRVRRMIIPEPLYELGFAAHERAAEPHRRTSEKILGAEGTDATDQPVYLSRRLLPNGRRMVIGERELEDVLRDNGFLVVHPEKLPLEEQIRLVNRHGDIFASDGSAVHAILFALNAPRLHFLAGDAIAADYFLSARVSGVEGHFINSLGNGGRKPVSRHSPQIVALDRVVDYLDHRQFLKSPARPSVERQSPFRQARFDEAWFFVRVQLAAAAESTLPEDDEQEACRIAENSWPLSLALARYYALQTPSRVDAMVQQFARLCAQETDSERLTHYRGEVRRIAERIVRLCEESTIASLAAVLERRFALDFEGHATFAPRDRTVPRSEAGCVDKSSADHESSPGETGDDHPTVLIVGINRTQLLSFLPMAGNVAEVGTFRGQFSERIRHIAEPRLLHLIDPWTCEGDRNPQYTNSTMQDAFERVQTIFREDIITGRVVLHRDYSTRVAPTFPDHSFDWIYIDGVHDFENVWSDLLAFKDKVKPDGFILGHDFSNYRNPKLFGVIPAVRKFIRCHGFELVLLTNETNPSFLLARAGNITTLASLKERLLGDPKCSIVGINESLLDRFQQVGVTRTAGRRDRLLTFG